eukprot:jgi/Psemu1/12100/gm1.12100_g
MVIEQRHHTHTHTHTHPQHQHQHQHPYLPQQEQPEEPAKSTAACRYCSTLSSRINRNMTNYIQHLNNRACVLMTIRNFAEANFLFESALKQHKRISCPCETNCSGLVIDGYDANNTRNVDVADTDMDMDMDMDLNLYESESDLDWDHEDCSDWDSEAGDEDDDDDDDGCYPTFSDEAQHPSQTTASHSLTATAATDMSGSAFEYIGQHRVCRMTSCSSIRTFSYGGQSDRRSQTQWMYHKVYSLPIVMSETEWEGAPFNDRSFVLIFNSALSNHLWGMELLSRQRPGHLPLSQFCQKDGLGYQRSFEIAKVLYELALENFSSSCRQQPSPQRETHQYLSDARSSSRGIHGVNSLCYAAVFNKLSHVCKTLEGYDSFNAYKWDTLLIKSVYWLIDSNHAANSHLHPQQHSETTQWNHSVTHATDTATHNNYDLNYSTSTLSNRNSNSNSSSSSYQHCCYDESDAEVIDAFLENVFYLLGVPAAMVPAAVA